MMKVEGAPPTQCYMCESAATSVEHAPPKCIFPEQKDAGSDYRKNLITVPSCERHNSAKSQDDEFLMVSLAGMLGNNLVGQKLSATKVNRAIVRSAGKLLDAVFQGGPQTAVVQLNGKAIEVMWGRAYHKRLERCFDRISRALFRHHFGRPYLDKVGIKMLFLYTGDEREETLKEFIQHRVEMDLSGRQKFGANTDVFYYQVTEPEENGLVVMKMNFFGGVDVYAALRLLEGPEPFDMTYYLIQNGLNVTIQMPGKNYVFRDIRDMK